MNAEALGLWILPIAIIGGAIKVSTPFLFVSLGEVLTEKSGRINLGLEGTLIFGAMSGYGISYLTGSPWVGVAVAAAAGMGFGTLHAGICQMPRVNDIAVGIALMLFGTGLAFYFGKPFIQPTAPRLPDLALGWWSDVPQLQNALRVNILFVAGVILAPFILWMLKNTRFGLVIQTVGDNAEAARALGYDVNRVRLIATSIGGAMAGIGGSSLSLYYPGSWIEGLSTGQGLMAVALVIFARWNPIYCLFAALLFGGAGALGPALQTVGVSSGIHLLNAAPYLLTLAILILTSSARRGLVGAPSELSVTK